jgi:co-chaperonin GroES (HSP10)
MIDNKKLAVDLSNKINYQPTYDWLLVKPLKPVMITKLLPVPPAKLPESVEEAETTEPTTPQKQRVEANVNKGIIIKLGTEYQKTNPENLEVGDVVLYPRNAGVSFELIKDSRMLRRYEVIGVERATTSAQKVPMTEMERLISESKAA